MPFRTFSGVVDTDMYELGVEFPFQLLNTITEDIFILEKGTPICQVIPFKRESWTMTCEHQPTKRSKLEFFLESAYRKVFHNKKEFK